MADLGKIAHVGRDLSRGARDLWIRPHPKSLHIVAHLHSRPLTLLSFLSLPNRQTKTFWINCVTYSKRQTFSWLHLNPSLKPWLFPYVCKEHNGLSKRYGYAQLGTSPHRSLCRETRAAKTHKAPLERLGSHTNNVCHNCRLSIPSSNERSQRNMELPWVIYDAETQEPSLWNHLCRLGVLSPCGIWYDFDIKVARVKYEQLTQIQLKYRFLSASCWLTWADCCETDTVAVPFHWHGCRNLARNDSGGEEGQPFEHLPLILFWKRI